MLQFHIITIFPNVVEPYLLESILGRAKEKGLVDFNLVDLRNFTNDKHRSVDDVPFGGGAGMVMKVEPIYKSIKSIKSKVHKVESRKLKVESQINNQKSEIGNRKSEINQNSEDGFLFPVSGFKTILLSAKGQKFTQQKARELSKYENIVLICGRYEGVDERVAEHIADEEISIGDYVLTGGELPAMVIADAVTRLVPGVISEESLKEESFSETRNPKPEIRSVGIGCCASPELLAKAGANSPSNSEKKTNILEYPQYTRPAVFKTDEGEEWAVPDVLLSGNHGEIEKWRSSSREAR